MPQPCHLHVHSHFTLLGATPTVDDLISTAKSNEMSHLALTDSNVLYGAVAFDRACSSAGIQAIVGMTLTVQLPQASDDKPDQLLLLARNADGYRSLCRLSSAIQSSPNRETLAQQGLPWETLKANHTGLIAIAGGRQSWLHRWTHQENQQAINTYLGRFASLFDDHGYLALEIHQSSDEIAAREITRLGRRFGLPLLAIQPVYTLHENERNRLRLLAAIDRNCPLGDVPTEALPDGGDSSVDLHWLHPGEMAERFATFPAALDEIQQLAKRCQPSLPDGTPIFPVLKLPNAISAEEALKTLAEEGQQTRFPSEGETSLQESAITTHTITPLAITQRLQSELALINRTGYAPLFLVVADIVRYARSQSIPVSTRGSVANSLVAYCTGITTVDPIANDLLFERFLNPERSNPPDIDLDFCSVRRDEVLEYVRRTYGAERVALVATISTMRPRSAIGETAKAYGLPEDEATQLAKLLPDEWHPDPRRRVHSTPDAMLAKIDNPQHRRIVNAAYEIIGTPHHLSIHPGGLVITPGPMTDFAPVQFTPKGFLIIQYDHEHAEQIGLAKLDLLGIRALTVLADAAHLIRQHVDPHFTLESIPLDDPLTAEMLATGDTVGVFQCESSGARRTLRQLKARSITDLAVANAFFKPGPATGGMAASFVRRYRGDEATSYLHPALEPILGMTKGVLIFQEQVLRVARQIAGLSWAEADYLRKGMSKFQVDAMATIRSRFIDGAVAVSGFSHEQASTLWEQVQAFAGYGFNQGHATAYADVSYRSAWVKAHHPAAFLAARLANYGGFHHPAIYIAEAQWLGIKVYPPHINHSEDHFSLGFDGKRPDGKQPGSSLLWMGLGQVQHLRQGTIQEIIAQRQRQSFTDLEDLLERVALQQREVLNLIRCGALDGLAENRASLLETFKQNGAGNKQQLAFDFASATPSVAAESVSERWRWEKEILGQPVSINPCECAVFKRDQVIGLKQAMQSSGRPQQMVGYRLPGWTGGKGFYFSDGDTYVVAVLAEKLATPKSWQPIQVSGRWLRDEWMSWLQIDSITGLELK